MLIIPLSLLFTFILIFSLVATKEITVTSQGEITPTSVIASIQSTSDNPILANHLVANQVVEKGTYSSNTLKQWKKVRKLP